MSAVPIWISYIKRSFERESVCGTKKEIIKSCSRQCGYLV